MPLISSNRLSIAALLSKVEAVSIAVLAAASLWSRFIAASVHTPTSALHLFTTNHLKSQLFPSFPNANESGQVALQCFYLVPRSVQYLLLVTDHE